LLIISEMLCDFEEIVQKMEVSQSKKAREFLSNKKGEIHSLFGFINNVCKHKVTSLHQCNHHIPIWFEDCNQSHSFTNPIFIENLDFDQPDGLLVPELGYFIQVVLNCYGRLDELFDKEAEKFKLICDKYNGTSYEL